MDVYAARYFAISFDKAFRKKTHGVGFGELTLFRALQSVLMSLSPKFHIEEYHGAAHQVCFQSAVKGTRQISRCELSDLMFLVFSRESKCARLTYFQAKSERCRYKKGMQFCANLEQWSLLANRPSIRGVGRFRPPSDLLSAALLDSVGSFGFFYRDNNNNCQVFYAAASQLAPSHSSKRKVEVLRTTPRQLKSINNECRLANGNKSFALNLYGLKIGTPLSDNDPRSRSLRSFLIRTLKDVMRRTSQEIGPVAQDFLQLWTDVSENVVEKSDNGGLGAKKIIILDANQSPG